MFASQCKKPVVIDDDTYTIRKLSHRSLDKARDAFMAGSAVAAKRLGGEMVRAYQEAAQSGAQQKLREKDKADPKARYSTYDKPYVLQAGIDSWTCERPLSPDAVDDLDEATAQKLFEDILEYSLPPATKEEIEVKEGNA